MNFIDSQCTWLIRIVLQQTVQVDRSALVALAQESLEKPAGIERLEAAATELYKALQAGRDRGRFGYFRCFSKKY